MHLGQIWEKVNRNVIINWKSNSIKSLNNETFSQNNKPQSPQKERSIRQLQRPTWRYNPAVSYQIDTVCDTPTAAKVVGGGGKTHAPILTNRWKFNLLLDFFDLRAIVLPIGIPTTSAKSRHKAMWLLEYDFVRAYLGFFLVLNKVNLGWNSFWS